MTPQMIERVTGRLAQLWSQMEDPLPSMQYAANRMAELGLSSQRPKRGDSPQQVARELFAENPAAVETMQSVRVMFDPKQIETADELIETVLPGNASA